MSHRSSVVSGQNHHLPARNHSTNKRHHTLGAKYVFDSEMCICFSSVYQCASNNARANGYTTYNHQRDTVKLMSYISTPFFLYDRTGHVSIGKFCP